MGNKLEIRVTKMEVVLKTLLETLTRMDARMEGMDHVIRGNGKPGLVADMATTVVRLDSLESSRNKWRDLFFTVAGCVVGGVILFLIQQQWSVRHDQQSVSPVQQAQTNHKS